MTNNEPKIRWYHWTLLSLCAVPAFIMGLLDIVYGAAPGSRFYMFDDIVVRVLGAGSILASVGLLLRRKWAFSSWVIVQALFVLELLVTHDFGADSPLRLTIEAVMVVLFYGVPVTLVMWLRPLMTMKPQGTTSDPSPNYTSSSH